MKTIVRVKCGEKCAQYKYVYDGQGDIVCSIDVLGKNVYNQKYIMVRKYVMHYRIFEQLERDSTLSGDNWIIRGAIDEYDY